MSLRVLLVIASVSAAAIGVAQLIDPGAGPAESALVTITAAPQVEATTPPTTTGPVVSTAVPSTAAATAATLSSYLSAFCPATVHAAVVDRDRQRAWLCDAGRAVHEFPFTGATSQPDPGTYAVYAKDLRSSSSSSQGLSTMTHFVAFTYGKFRGARIAFHSVPTWGNGEYVQPLDSVGDVGRRGESAGCLRVLPDDAVRVWDWLAAGDEVRVIN